MLLSKALTPSTLIWPNLNIYSIKLVVRTGQILIRSLRFGMVLTLRYVIDLLNSLISLASTPISYELFNS
jgi:hypothetical protein